MEVRCGKCDKLFRISDDKISGRGIKFACTRCGEPVIITKEDLEQYRSSKTAVPIPDNVVPVQEPAHEPPKSEGEGPAVEERMPSPEPTPIQTPKIEPMEVRCGKCNKLFRVPGDKITGTGIKFACTRCGESVIITKEDFEQYRLSETAVPVPENVVPEQEPPRIAPKPAVPVPENAVPEQEPPKITPKPEDEIPLSAFVPKTFDLTFPSAPDTLLEEQPLSFAQPTTTVEPTPSAPSAPEPQPEPAPELQQKAEPAAIPQKEHAPGVAQKIATKAPVAASSPSAKNFILLIVLLIAISLGGVGVYMFFTSASKNEASRSLSSTEGLLITNVTSTTAASGDLIITGVVENTTDKEQAAWYVVAEIYNTQGTMLNKIRLLKGKQLYTRKDYEILAKRGENVEDLKAKTLQEQGVVIPAKGSVAFEMRYVQPPDNIASFNVTLLPFDPVRTFKELAEEIK